MPRKSRQSHGQVPEHITKARLVEGIVALIHEGQDVTVERNVRLPSLSDSSQIREIDVLVTGNLAGYPVRLPVECKNLGKPITTGQIGDFRDKLEDVGLPVRNSIFVSAGRFGRDARRRARDHGIRLFELEGLTPDRLSSAVHQAFQSAVFLLLRVEQVSFQSGRDTDELWSVMWLRDKCGNYRGGLWDIIWEKWRQGEIPTTWGLQELVISPPAGWEWHIDDLSYPRTVTVSLKVIALVLTAAGEASFHILNDILEQKYDRAHIRAIFRDQPEAIELTVVEDEEQLQAALQPGGIASIVHQSERTPRIHILNKLYWPPTEKSVDVLSKRVEAMTAVGEPDWNSLSELTFEELEGTDIGAIWGKTWSGHPLSRGEDWPIKFPHGASRSARTAPAPRRLNPKKKRQQR